MFQARHLEVLRASSGFFLIEVLVALAVIAISLPVIGSLLATDIRGSLKVEQNVGLLAAFRTIEANLLERVNLLPGERAGESDGFRWSIIVEPWREDETGARKRGVWVPQAITATVRAPSGETIEIETVRLRKRTAPTTLAPMTPAP